MKNILLIFFVMTSQLVAASSTCEAEFLGLTNLNTSSELSYVRRVEVLETIRNKIRRRKSQRHIVEVDKYNFKLYQGIDEQLYQGRIAGARDKWQGLFRRVERSYYFIVKKTQLIGDIRRLQMESSSMVLRELNLRYSESNDKFILDILKSLKSKNHNSAQDLIEILGRDIKVSGTYLGWKISNYEFINTQLDLIVKNTRCGQPCKKQIALLRSELGVSSKKEQEAFSFLKGLKKVEVNKVTQLVNSVPAAKQARLLRVIVHELRQYIQELVTKPKWRQAVASALLKITPDWKMIVYPIDKLLLEALYVNDHYFPIDKVLKRMRTINQKYEKLKNQNTLFLDDELLVTFARREDQAAVSTWAQLKIHAQKKDIIFYEQMLSAEVRAAKRSKLPAIYNTSPYRLTVYMLAGTGAFAYLYFNFDELDSGEQDGEKPVSINPDGSIEDLGEVELDDDGQIIEITSQEQADKILDFAQAIMAIEN